MATYYVDQAGDNTTGASPAHGKTTIAAGLALMSGGDTLIIGAGTYAEGIRGIDVPVGTSINYTKIQTAPAATVIIQPSGLNRGVDFDAADGNLTGYVEFDGFVFDGVNTTHTNAIWPSTQGSGIDGAKISGFFPDPGANTDHIRIKNSEIKNFGNNGVLVGAHGGNEFINLNVHHNGDVAYLSGVSSDDPYRYSHGFYIASSDNIIDGCLIHDHNTGPLQGGVQFFSTAHKVDNNIARSNTVYNNFSGGLFMSSGTGNMFYNNVLYSNGGGIGADSGSVNGKIYNNTMHGNFGFAIAIGASASVLDNTPNSGNDVRNNITDNNATNTRDLGAGTTFSNNLADSAGPMITIVGDALFVDKPTHDYHLTVSSPAIGAATVLTSVFTVDRAHSSRGAVWDIGAYEYAPGAERLMLSR